ncbi:hypothetical protein IWW38_000484 [Coemansia aciculifera]|uniref:Uncharacterized protein n=1 Tax=Coemansia aciculifera TaxID=417176 RepID=A0ACC1MAU9_9FUNG|nr:hypothetical protein IWW38_000484 [Coemansia aciculifera]
MAATGKVVVAATTAWRMSRRCCIDRTAGIRQQRALYSTERGPRDPDNSVTRQTAEIPAQSNDGDKTNNPTSAAIGYDAGFRDGYMAGFDYGHTHLESILNPQKKLKVTVLAADNLYKRELFRLPDPFVVLTVDGAQTQTTKALKRTLSPYWNETFEVSVKPSSVITAQVFDQRKFKKRGQGFLGVINVQVSQHINVAAGGEAMVTQDLRNSNNSDPVQGRLAVQFRVVSTTPPTESR